VGILDGKSVVVTGAGVGLGRAYALHAAAEGAAVVVNDVLPEAAEGTAADIVAMGGTAVATAGSVASWGDAERVIAACIENFGVIDGLVNNAGVIRVTEPWLATESDIRLVVETNVMGAVFMGVHALKLMVARGRGAIVNNTSSAQLGLPNMGVYGATKGALSSLTYSWAMDVAPHGIRVNAYSPVAATAMVDVSSIALHSLPSPDDNAPVVSYLLSDRAEGVSGQVIQRRDDSLVVMSHPDLTEHSATPSEWTAASVSQAFATNLRAGLQPVGDPRVRGSV
jgi:NAD(P)-dependent dehydrogenase (short-subunit alcohol dehydrogenase family)